MSYHAELLETDAELAAVAQRWQQLAESAENPFVSPAWFRAIRTRTGSDWVPAVVATYKDANLVGLLPFIRSTRRRKKAVMLAGADLADILEPAAAPEEQANVARAAADVLSDIAPRSTWALGRVHADASWWRELTANQHARVLSQGPDDILPYFDLPATWDDYLASRSRSFRSQLGRKMRSLGKEHTVTTRCSSTEVDVLADIEILFRLHDRRWEERQESTAFGPRVRDLHRRFAKETAMAGWARVYVMEIDGTPSAAWYGWRLGDRMLYYQAGFDPAWHEYSVGFLLLGETVKGAIEEGCTAYDMLLGDEGFKSRFADQERIGRIINADPRLSTLRLRSGARNLARSTWRRLPGNVRNQLQTFRR